VVSAPGEPTRLEQRGDAGVLFFRVAVRVVLEIVEHPLERIAFRAVGGDMKSMQGHWALRREGETLLVSYEAEIEPDFWLPPWIGDMVLRTSVEKQVSGVVKEMLKRHALQRKQSRRVYDLGRSAIASLDAVK
jgi:hypothetical protein